jgi:ribosomal protein RSM22 (predicted rRNA methylase)
MSASTPDLPPELRQSLTALAAGKSGIAMAQRAAELSRLYRSGGSSADAIRTAEDALAYALVRMPATFAAVTAVLAALGDADPDFAPATLVEAGAGPGTGAFAAAQHFPALHRVRLIDDNPYLREIALTLLASGGTPALRAAAYEAADLTASPRAGGSADLVIASYLVGELAPDALLACADRLWSMTGGMLAVVEPGTTAGFQRIRDLRAHLIAQGAHVVAPCPHDGPCPIVAPDWCHFAQRLPRSRDHQRIKGAALGFEDEKFSYVVLARTAPRRIAARVLAHPRITKGEASAKLCTVPGITTASAGRRERERYRQIKGWRWGDAVPLAAE